MEFWESKVEGFCCQAPSEPRLALLRHQGFRFEIYRTAYAARRTSSAKLSFAVSLIARNGGQGREKANTFRRLSMLIGPKLTGDTREGFGGAAGNRTRVQSAYYVRVYLHRQGKP